MPDQTDVSRTTRWKQREAAEAWRRQHVITDWEFAEIGRLLCDHQPRDLALMVVRLEGQLEVAKQLAETRRG